MFCNNQRRNTSYRVDGIQKGESGMKNKRIAGLFVGILMLLLCGCNAVQQQETELTDPAAEAYLKQDATVQEELPAKVEVPAEEQNTADIDAEETESEEEEKPARCDIILKNAENLRLTCIDPDVLPEGTEAFPVPVTPVIRELLEGMFHRWSVECKGEYPGMVSELMIEADDLTLWVDENGRCNFAKGDLAGKFTIEKEKVAILIELVEGSVLSETGYYSQQWLDCIELYREVLDTIPDEEEIGYTIYYIYNLLDLDGNGAPELILWSNGGPSVYSMTVFTVENGEVRQFNTYQTNNDPNMLTCPASQNSMEADLGSVYLCSEMTQEKMTLWPAGSVRPPLQYTDNVTGETVWLVTTEDIRETPQGFDTGGALCFMHVTTTWKFGQKNGALYAERLYEWSGVSNYDDLSWIPITDEAVRAAETVALDERYVPILGIDYGEGTWHFYLMYVNPEMPR